jgi:apolipoprotein N-acyltransferase
VSGWVFSSALPPNTGISAAVDPLGRFLARLPAGEPGSFVAALPRPLPPTLYARFGDAIAAGMALVLAGLAMLRRGNRL